MRGWTACCCRSCLPVSYIALGFPRLLRQKAAMRLRLPHRIFGLAALAGVGVGASAVLAQIEGQDRGVMPIDSGSAYEVSGVTGDVSGKTAEDARRGGWRIAQRKGWAMLAQRLGRSGVGASDGMLDSLVAGIVGENEQIGPTRYVARLGVLFDRTRAASVLPAPPARLLPRWKWRRPAAPDHRPAPPRPRRRNSRDSDHGIRDNDRSRRPERRCASFLVRSGAGSPPAHRHDCRNQSSAPAGPAPPIPSVRNACRARPGGRAARDNRHNRHSRAGSNRRRGGCPHNRPASRSRHSGRRRADHIRPPRSSP